MSPRPAPPKGASRRHQLAILKNGTASPQEQADALRFVIHFVGDLHQPLHCTTNNDRGGNCVPVKFFGDNPSLSDPAKESYTPNLHGIWDTNMITRMTRNLTTEELAILIDHAYEADAATWTQQPVDLEGWAWESYQAAKTTAYGKLPRKIKVEQPVEVKTCADADHVSTRMLALHEQLGQTYQNAAEPMVKKQLAKAGVRLAIF